MKWPWTDPHPLPEVSTEKVQKLELEASRRRQLVTMRLARWQDSIVENHFADDVEEALRP